MDLNRYRQEQCNKRVTQNWKLAASTILPYLNKALTQIVLKKREFCIQNPIQVIKRKFLKFFLKLKNS